MNFLLRAWRYVTRRKAKTILLMITFFLIGNLVILGLGISQAADNAKILTRQSMRAAVRYEIDYDAFWQYADNIEDEDERQEAYSHSPRLSKETADQIAGDPRVKAVNYMNSNVVYSSGFSSVPVGNEENRGGSSYYMDENGEQHEYIEPNIMMYGVMNPNMIEIAEETWTISEGRFLNESDIEGARNSVIITKDLADQNGLRVGDEISVTTMGGYEIQEMENMGLTQEDATMTMEIVGIFNTLAEVDPNSDRFQWMSAYESPKNIIVVPMSYWAEWYEPVLRKQYEYYRSEYGSEVDTDSALEQLTNPSTVVFLLDDPLHVEEFVKDYEGKLDEYTKLNANNDTFRKMARPLDTLSFFANIIVWIVVINAIVIISLVTALTLKTREYEIGVLLSMGVSKLKVVGQLFAELIIIAIAGFTLAVASGSVMAGKVGEAVLEYQTASEAQYEDGNNYGQTYYWAGDGNYFTEVSQEQLLSEYHVRVSPKLIAEIYILGTGVVLLAIVIPSFMIMRLNPKQILLEQN